MSSLISLSEPITDQSKWELAENLNELELKELALHTFAHAAYTELIVSLSDEGVSFCQKTKEELAKEAGMMSGIITRIVDNLQVSIKNIHVRIENENLEDAASTFSLGVTLGSV